VTITQERPALWSALPGWGITADLTPRELINARQLKVLRRVMAAGIVALLVACAVGYYLAAEENSTATADLASVQDRTAQLQGEGRGYSDVVSIQRSVGQVKDNIAQLMTADVDLSALMASLSSDLPATMTITEEAITISPAGVAGADSSASASGLDTSGLPRIGIIKLSGTGQTLDDLSDYIDRLHAVPGLVDVLPVANAVATSGGSGTQFSLSAGLTNAALSHRFDVGG
jgi:hypothetical protein